jgi:hypothetical protein
MPFFLLALLGVGAYLLVKSGGGAPSPTPPVPAGPPQPPVPTGQPQPLVVTPTIMQSQAPPLQPVALVVGQELQIKLPAPSAGFKWGEFYYDDIPTALQFLGDVPDASTGGITRVYLAIRLAATPRTVAGSFADAKTGNVEPTYSHAFGLGVTVGPSSFTPAP